MMFCMHLVRSTIIAILLCDIIIIITTVCHVYSSLSFTCYNESVDYQSCLQLWLKFCTENVCKDHSIVAIVGLPFSLH